MSLREQNDLKISGQVIELRDQNDLRIGPESARVQIISPTQGQTDFPQNGNYVVQPFQGFEYYGFKTSANENFEPPIEDKIVKATELQSELDANAQYHIQVSAKRVVQPSDVIDEVTGVSISSGSTITEGQNRIFTITISGTGDFSTDYTASIISGAGTISQSGNQVTVTANANSHPGDIEFQVNASGVTESRTLTISEVAESVDSLQGDFDALQALFNSTQGQDLPTLNSTSELPSPNNATYPYMYLIDGEIHWLKFLRHGGFDNWRNAGAPWKIKTGWENMTPETMGDAVGISTDENGRVVDVDMQKITTRPGTAEGTLTDGNNLCGILPPQIGNLKKVKRFNVKQNYLFGPIAPEIGLMTELERLSLAGHHWEIDLDSKVNWVETSHVHYNRNNGEDPFSYSVSGKDVPPTNRFKGDLPEEIGNLSNLKLIELNHQFLQGVLPNNWGNLSELQGLFISRSREVENGLYSEIPDSWGNLTNIRYFRMTAPIRSVLFGTLPSSMLAWENLVNISITDNDLSGPFPFFTGPREITYFNISRNDFTGDFPWESIFNGDNSRLSKFGVANNDFTGPFPETIPQATFPTTSRPFYNVDAFGVEGNRFSGPIPNWVTKITGMQIMNFSGNQSQNNIIGSSVLPEGFNDNESNMYNNFRVMFMNNTEVGGSLPKTVWNNTDVQGSITANSGDQVTTDQSLGLVLSGTITQSASNYIRNTNANHLQEWGGLMEVTVIVPDGENITWTAVMFADNTTYIWSPDSLDTSGLENLTYEVRLPLIGSTFLAKSGDDGFVREIVGSSDNGLTLDSSIEEDITGYTFTVHRPANQLFYIYMSNNNFSGRIPIEWSAIRTPRALEIVLNGNNLSGYVDPGLGKIPNLARLEIRNNNFTEEDLEDLIAATPPEILDY